MNQISGYCARLAVAEPSPIWSRAFADRRFRGGYIGPKCRSSDCSRIKRETLERDERAALLVGGAIDQHKVVSIFSQKLNLNTFIFDNCKQPKLS
jgi:hypothetical protein